MNIPAELKYTKDHEWARIDGDVVTVGITDYAQGELGDIVYVDLPDVGDEVERDESFGTIEAVKAVSDLYAPLSGEIVEINESLGGNEEIINTDPYKDGWMIKIRISSNEELNDLLDHDAYAGLL